jgi:cytochrome c5
VSADHDRTFFDTFMLVLGILVVVTIGLIFLARHIANQTSVPRHLEDPLNQAEVASRIEPVARVAIAGKDNAALNPPAAAPAAAAADLAGEDVYKQVCTMCHGAAHCTRHRHAAQARAARLPGQGRIHAAEGRARRPVRQVDHERGGLPRLASQVRFEP